MQDDLFGFDSQILTQQLLFTEPLIKSNIVLRMYQLVIATFSTPELRGSKQASIWHESVCDIEG